MAPPQRYVTERVQARIESATYEIAEIVSAKPPHGDANVHLQAQVEANGKSIDALMEIAAILAAEIDQLRHR